MGTEACDLQVKAAGGVKLTTLLRLVPTLKRDGQKVKVKFTLEQATKAQSGSRSIALLFL